MKKCYILLALAVVGCQVKVNEPEVTTKQAANSSSQPVASQPPKAAETHQSEVDDSKRIHELKDLRKTKITLNGQVLDTYVMDNDSLREEGLMFVKDEEVKPNQAMLFVFPDSQERSFWMHNTIMPLDIAYIGSDKKVVSVATMKPLDDTSVPSHGKAMYALEMKKGTIERFGIRAGNAVDIAGDIKATE